MTLPFEHFRVGGNELGPKLTHHPRNVIWPMTIPIRMLVAERTKAHRPRVKIAEAWRKGRISRLVDDALRGNIELGRA